MSEYVPTTDEVRQDFAYPWEGFKQDRAGRLDAFNRWLVQTIRQAKAEAWDEGYRASGIVYPTLPPKYPTNPYTEEDKTND